MTNNSSNDDGGGDDVEVTSASIVQGGVDGDGTMTTLEITATDLSSENAPQQRQSSQVATRNPVVAASTAAAAASATVVVKTSEQEVVKLTRLNLAGIAVKESTTRWTHQRQDVAMKHKNDGEEQDDDEESFTTPAPNSCIPPQILDVRSCWCVSVSGLMTVLCYSITFGAVPALVAVSLWIFKYQDANGTGPLSVQNNTSTIIP